MVRAGIRTAVVVAFASLGLSLPVLAQSSMVGAIGGTITDTSGAVLPGVTLTLLSPGAIGNGQTTTSDGQGDYQFTRLVPRKYSVKAELSGFRTIVQENVDVNADRTARVDLRLAVGSVEESVIVSAIAPLLDTTSALKQTELTRTVLDTVPTGHDIWSITRLAVAVQPSTYDVGGRGMMDQGVMLSHGSLQREQGYLLDGLDVTSPQESAANYFFDTFVAQEVNVQSGQMSAEQSKSGVLMNVVTKTGTDTFSGSGMFDGANHSLEASNVSDPTLRAQLLAGVPAKALAANPNIVPGSSIQHLFDSAATFGGPIIKDRLWFFGSQRYSELYRFIVGSYNADGTQLLDDNSLNNTLWKVTSSLTPKTQLHMLLTWQSKFQGHVNPGTSTQFIQSVATADNDGRVWIGIPRWTQVLSTRLMLDVAGEWQSQNNAKPPQAQVQLGKDIPEFDTVTNTISVASPTYSEPTHGYKQQLQSSLTYTAGNHDVKVGYQFVRAERTQFFISVSDYPAGLQAIYANGVPTSVKTFNTPTGSIYFNLNHAVYAQDKWRVTRKLTLNLGLRVEHENERVNDGVSPLCQQGTIYIVAQCFPAISGVPDWYYASPRTAAIYDLFGDGRTALKFVANRYKVSTIGLTSLVNPIAVKNDTRPWTVCAPGQTSGCDLNHDLLPQFNELGPSTGFNLGTTNRIDPGLKVPYTNEIAAEIEQQLKGNMVFSGGYHYRARRDLIGAANQLVPTSSYTPIVVTEKNSGQQVTVYNQSAATKGLFDMLYSNHPELNDSFNSVDFSLQKRMSNHWMVMGSMSFEKTQGNINTNSQSGQAAVDLNNPNFTFQRGPFVSDTPFFAKINGMYEAPYGIRIAASMQYYTGLPTLTTVLVDATTVKLTQGSQTVIVAPFGTTRLPSISTTDLNFTKVLRHGHVTFEPHINIFNIFNQNAKTAEVTQLGPSYGFASALLGSRLIKLGANITF